MKQWTGFILLVVILTACQNEQRYRKAEVTIDAECPEIDRGRTLFQRDCASCHHLVKEATGPALVGSYERWHNDTIRLHAFISNAPKSISENDTVAIRRFQEYDSIVMPPNPHLTESDIRDIMAFVCKPTGCITY